MFLELPIFMQSYCLSFMIQINDLRMIRSVSRSFQIIVSAPATWAGLIVNLLHFAVPRQFYYDSREMLRSAARIIVSYSESRKAAQLGCPLWTSWIPKPPFNRRNMLPVFRLGPHAPRLLSEEPVAHTVEVMLKWTGSLYLLDIGLTNASSLWELDAALNFYNPRRQPRAFCLVFFMRPSMLPALSYAGPWFINSEPCGFKPAVDIQPSIVDSHRDPQFSHRDSHELHLKVKWTISRMSVYSQERLLATQGFGPAFSRPYLDSQMRLFLDVTPTVSVMASVTPVATYLGPGGLHIRGAQCHYCIRDFKLARNECTHCRRLYCEEHGGHCAGCILASQIIIVGRWV